MGVLGSSAFRQDRRVRFVCGSNKMLACARCFTTVITSTGSAIRVAVISFSVVFRVDLYQHVLFGYILYVAKVSGREVYDDSLPWLIDCV